MKKEVKAYINKLGKIFNMSRRFLESYNHYHKRINKYHNSLYKGVGE